MPDKVISMQSHVQRISQFPREWQWAREWADCRCKWEEKMQMNGAGNCMKGSGREMRKGKTLKMVISENQLCSPTVYVILRILYIMNAFCRCIESWMFIKHFITAILHSIQYSALCMECNVRILMYELTRNCTFFLYDWRVRIIYSAGWKLNTEH